MAERRSLDYASLRSGRRYVYRASGIEAGGMMAKKSKKKAFKKHIAFSGRMVMIGFGSIGQGVLPLIFRHIDIKPQQITIISADDRGGLKETRRFGVQFIRKRQTEANLRQT